MTEEPVGHVRTSEAATRRSRRVKQRFVLVWVLCCLVFAGAYTASKYWPDSVPARERIQAGPKGNFKIKTSVGEVVSICDGPFRLYLTSTGGITALEDDRCITPETS